MAMTNLLEQACNRYLQADEFPTTYQALQDAPVLTKGQLTFAGDDGMQLGQTYRARIEMSQFCDIPSRQEHRRASLWLKLRAPTAQGKWAWGDGAKKWCCRRSSSPPSIGARPLRLPLCGKSRAMTRAAWPCSI
jgi:hypothetical protein